jgi:hypothetical protein
VPANHIALESIDFQDGAFFAALVDAINKIKEVSRDDIPKGPGFYNHPAVVNLLAVIEDRTNLKLEYEKNYGWIGPAIISPYLTINHVFLRDSVREDKQVPGLVADDLKVMDSPYFKGTVDLKNSKVHGEFTKSKSTLFMPIEMLYYGRLYGIPFSVEEVAAALLHEIGHTFIALEYADRVVTTNQVLATINACLKNDTPETRELIFAHAAKRMRMSKEQRKALENCKDDTGRGVILATIAVEQSVSELGGSIFDITSCEQLADQFAARHGAAAPLMTAISKISEHNPKHGYWWRQVMTGTAFAVLSLVMPPVGVVSSLLVILSAVWTADKSSDLYGTFHSRLTRMKGEMIRRLRDRDIDDTEKKRCLDAIAVADRMLAMEMDRLNFYDTIAYYVKPSFRAAHKFEVLQRQLEALANNNLFAKAAKLSTL